jgi:uncharacterized protein (TIGR03437 family)
MKHKYLFTVSVALLGATWSFSQTLNSLPSRVLGHPNPEQIANVVSASPNLVEGRELYYPDGLALDTSVTPPILYVSDTYNNRVLAWKNATSFSNGAFADMVIGQNDPYSTLPQGPAGSASQTGFLQTGVCLPSGLAVRNGDLYVVDAGNNRILRFPKPFSQGQLTVVYTGSAPQQAVQVGAKPDLVIGQPGLTTGVANYFATLSSTLTAQGIFTASGGSVYPAGLAFDSGGNLWFADTGNARVLRFPAANIPASNAGSTKGGISADLVIGQPTLTSSYPNNLSKLTNPMLIKNQVGVVGALGFDPSGRLFVVDDAGDGTTSYGRVLVFATPASLPSGGGSADRVMGVVPSGELTTLGYTGTQANTFDLQTWINSPGGVFFLADGSVGIVDSGFNRIMIFPPYSQWPPESTNYSPLANSVIGQGSNTNFLTYWPNNAQTTAIANGTPPASANGFRGPAAAVFLPSSSDPNGNELFVADTFNNRVIVMPQSGGIFQPGTRVLGQDRTNTNSANLIEGREYQFVVSGSSGSSVDAGIALDTTGSTPHLYVSDPYNNRVLGYYDARLVKAGNKADLVIGQPDFQTALCNYNTAASNGIGGDPTTPTQSSLCEPVGLAVDKSGNLYVADSNNGRVLRFPAPFANYPAVPTLESADLVLGQAGFTAQVRQASAFTMYAPYGLAFSGSNGLLVSDAVLNRVLYYQFTSKGTFTAGVDNGRAASKVFGQSDFVSKASGSGFANFNTPLHVAADGEGRIYVADTGNSRVSIFPDPNSPYTTSGMQDSYSITGLGAARGVWIDPNTDEIWIANTTNDNCLRYAQYSSLYAGITTPNLTVPAVSYTLAMATDQNGALYVADGSNRIAIYYPALQALNGASFMTDRAIAPAMIASLCAPGSNCTSGAPAFGSQTATYSGFPAPTVLGDTQVNLVNGTTSTPAPLFYVSPAQINFYVPSSAPTSGNANIEVVQKSTGQVLAAGLASMSGASPGVFMQQFTGTQRQAAVRNQDSSINSSTNPAARGSVISIYATGQGVIPGLPADGVGAPSSPLVTVPKTLTEVIIGTCLLSEGTAAPVGCANQPGDVGTSGSVSSNWIPFTGLAPTFAGLWQINAQIPMAVTPGAAALMVIFNGTASTDPLSSSSSAFQTVIYVK